MRNYLFWILASSIIIISLSTISLNYRTMKRLDALSSSLSKKHYSKELHISYQLKELKKIQEQASEKMENCHKDKSCYSKPSYKQLLLDLRDKGAIVHMIFGEACPEYAKDTKEYEDYVRWVEKKAGESTNPLELNIRKVPEDLEQKTRDLIDASFINCEAEYARKSY